MTKAIELTNVTTNEDRFAVVSSSGEILTTHPRLTGAIKLSERFNATGSF